MKFPPPFHPSEVSLDKEDAVCQLLRTAEFSVSAGMFSICTNKQQISKDTTIPTPFNLWYDGNKSGRNLTLGHTALIFLTFASFY